MITYGTRRGNPESVAIGWSQMICKSTENLLTDICFRSCHHEYPRNYRDSVTEVNS